MFWGELEWMKGGSVATDIDQRIYQKLKYRLREKIFRKCKHTF